MRKLTVVAMAVLAVLAFAASVFAVQAEIPANTSAVVAKAKTQITLGGELAIRGRIFKNLDLTQDSQSPNGNDSFYQYQYILNLTAVTGKTKGVIELYSGNTGWVKWGKSSFQQGVNGYADANSDGLTFRQLYIAFPVMGLNVSVGHQLGQLGVASFLDFSKEGADMILVSYPIDKKSSIAIGTIKLEEDGSLTSTDTNDKDKDIYFATADIDLGGHMLGINIANLRDKDGLTTTNQKELWNWGLTLKGKLMSNLSYVFAGDLQRGENYAATKVKNRGYHLRGVLNYQATPELGLKLASIYYSGDKGNTAEKQEGFVTLLEDKNYATFIYGYLIRGVQAGTALTANSTNIGPGAPVPAGTWFNVLGANYKFSKDLSAGLDFIWLRGTYKEVANMSYNNSSKKIGWELDANIAYNLGDNLVYSVMAGMFDPGSAWARATDDNNKKAYAFEHKITYKF